MTHPFRLPDLGEGVHEGEVLAVHVTAGGHVREGDVILEVETDKAAVEIPSPFSGTVGDVRVQAGDTIRVGDVLIVFDDGAQAPVQGAPAVREDEPPLPAKNKQRPEGPVPASPATRRLARELGVDLRQVEPTGRGGVVTADDVQAFARSQERPELDTAPAPSAITESSPTAPAGPAPDTTLPDFARWGSVQRVPFRSLRRATARQMVTAWTRIPHVNSQDSVDITNLEAFRRKHKAEIEAAGGRLTLTIFALKAAATALKMYPQVNASLDETAQEIVLKQYYHIGVAVNTDDGLIVPVIRDVDRKSIKELAVELWDLTQRTRSRKVSREELRGGSFTITNAGAMGGGYFTPIINYPEVAILGMGQARLQPVVVGEGETPRIEPRLIMPMVLCIDHRVLDGADAIRFLKAMVDALEDPDELLLAMT
jgi:pyruvate dehydrogenase E2 component (dihydrolipoamide acetyltransferase)